MRFFFPIFREVRSRECTVDLGLCYLTGLPTYVDDRNDTLTKYLNVCGGVALEVWSPSDQLNCYLFTFKLWFLNFKNELSNFDGCTHRFDFKNSFRLMKEGKSVRRSCLFVSYCWCEKKTKWLWKFLIMRIRLVWFISLLVYYRTFGYTLLMPRLK